MVGNRYWPVSRVRVMERGDQRGCNMSQQRASSILMWADIWCIACLSWMCLHEASPRRRSHCHMWLTEHGVLIIMMMMALNVVWSVFHHVAWAYKHKLDNHACCHEGMSLIAHAKDGMQIRYHTSFKNVTYGAHGDIAELQHIQHPVVCAKYYCSTQTLSQLCWYSTNIFPIFYPTQADARKRTTRVLPTLPEIYPQVTTLAVSSVKSR